MKRLNRRQQLNTVTPTEEKEPNDVWHFDIELESNDRCEQPIIKIDNNDYLIMTEDDILGIID